jgi:CheY-like chemotaxis protein
LLVTLQLSSINIAPKPSSQSSMPKRILIADDNPRFRRALRHLLEGVDRWEIIEVNDGQEAVTKSVETRPDLIILDLAMPVKDGLAAAREISQLLPGIPVLMCTMHISSYLEGEAKKWGIRQVLSKTDSNLILPAIRQWLTPQEPPVQESEAVSVTAPITVPVPVVASEPPPASVVSPATAAETATNSPTDLPKNVA